MDARSTREAAPSCHRATCMTYLCTVVIAQVGWVTVSLLSLSLEQMALAGGSHHRALGEGVAGAVASHSAVVDAQGWTLDAVPVAAAGLGLTQTAAAAFSARARPGLGGSMSASWEQLSLLKSGAQLTMATARE